MAVWHFKIKHQLIDVICATSFYITSITSHLRYIDFASLVITKTIHSMIARFTAQCFQLNARSDWFLKNATTTTTSLQPFQSELWIGRIPKLDDIDWLLLEKTFLTSGFRFCSCSIWTVCLLSCQFFVHHIFYYESAPCSR